jgi:hypothetical protein
MRSTLFPLAGFQLPVALTVLLAIVPVRSYY